MQDGRVREVQEGHALRDVSDDGHHKVAQLHALVLVFLSVF